ncbi:integral membrane sensor signal transduction histidine kinase [Granulicella mallensis MP5ACTX8]|uniref:histidine kinase n=2 Tax=Granulicella mallensis TaxID=940614 RepID=G8NYB8_GRAMM|nr:integral membrane sensor signal transduction histidine kinase [Granulicella mallensis MP5ACTX8]
MKINLRSLRIRLFMLYIIFALTSMICLGSFSYWYLNQKLASSRQHTMEAREKRVIEFVDTWPKKDTSLSLAEKLRQLSIGIASTDIIQVYELDGTPIYSSPGDATFKIPWPNKACLERCYGLLRQNGHAIRTLDHIVELDGHKVRLSLSGSIDEHFEILQAVRNSYLLFCPLLLLASMAGGFVLSNRALEPVSRMTTEARKIGIRDLERRLPVPDTGDELQVLAETWNELLGRIETAVERLTQFTGDLSHDLSTTITIMLTTAGLALSRERSNEEYRTALSTISVECEATSQLLDDLLAVARADMVHKNIEWKPVDISELVRQVCHHFEAKARLKGQLLTFNITEETWMLGDLSLLRRMVTILLDNATKYTPESGSILISLIKEHENIQLEVSDTGIGIPADALPKIFDRFYRVDESRSQDEGSSGLGLSIAKWVVEAHRSTISVDSTPGKGSTFTVFIPLVEPILATETSYLAASVG